MALSLVTLAAAGIRNAAPWWFVDNYASPAFVDVTHTTASVATSPPGGVELPLARAGLTFSPLASVALLATANGVQGWVFDGREMIRAPQYDLSGRYVSAAWPDGPGQLVAVATAHAVSLAAWNGSKWTIIANLGDGDVRSIAEGPPVAGAAATILAGEPTGFQVLAYRGQHLEVVAGAGVDMNQGMTGISSAPGGSMVAVWAARALRVFAWDGVTYRETPIWEAPPSTQPILATAWFRDGNGYWVLTADGRLSAYAIVGSTVVPLPQLSTALHLPVLTLATGWREGEVAALTASGWEYFDGPGGAPFAVDPQRSMMRLPLGAYQTSGYLQSTVFNVGHDIDEVQIDASATLPGGTAIRYAVSTDGGVTWTWVPACVNAPNGGAACGPDNSPVPTGSRLAYRLLLSTVDPSLTPIVHVTDILEIATEVEAASRVHVVLVK